jgi:hypothetical protein
MDVWTVWKKYCVGFELSDIEKMKRAGTPGKGLNKLDQILHSLDEERSNRKRPSAPLSPPTRARRVNPEIELSIQRSVIPHNRLIPGWAERESP